MPKIRAGSMFTMRNRRPSLSVNVSPSDEWAFRPAEPSNLPMVRVLRDSSAAEMELAFVRAEASSPLFAKDYVGPLLRGREHLVHPSAGVTDRANNAQRRAILSRYRGYGRNALLFQGFPPADAIDWKLAEFSVEELGAFEYAVSVGVRTWATLSGGSRRVRDGAANVDALRYPDPETRKNIEHIRGIEGRIGSERPLELDPVIAVSERDCGRYVLVEGHKRATAYVRALAPSETVEAFIGYTDDLSGWTFN